MSMPKHLRTGYRGEQLAAQYLRKKGYYILAANYATKVSETDIIALSPDDIVCYVEVKTRSPGQMLPPSVAVGAQKEKNLTSNASVFSRHSAINSYPIRFDIIEVILYDLFTADINHIIDAF